MVNRGIPRRLFRDIPLANGGTGRFLLQRNFRGKTAVCAGLLISGDGAMEVITQWKERCPTACSNPESSLHQCILLSVFLTVTTEKTFLSYYHERIKER